MKRIDITEYKKRFYDVKNTPGEHHFVSVYLLNKFSSIPDYVNPDGTKKVCGDICFKNNDKEFAIEVKFKKIRFSKTENNNWFVEKKEPLPKYIIILSDNYLFIIPWKDFSDVYNNKFPPKKIEKGNKNSPILSEMDLVNNISKKFIFELKDSDVEKKIINKISEINKEIEEFYVWFRRILVYYRWVW